MYQASLRVFDGELENDVFIGDVLVDLAEGVQLGLDVHKVLGVKQDLEGLGAIDLVSHSLADDLGRVDDVLKASNKRHVLAIHSCQLEQEAA